MAEQAWHIIGGEDVAQHLRAAAPYVDVAQPTTIVTDAATVPQGAIATGRAMLAENAGQIVPHLLGFRAIDEVSRAVHAGEVGQIYGCYGAYRVPRGTEPEHVAMDALLPLIAVT